MRKKITREDIIMKMCVAYKPGYNKIIDERVSPEQYGVTATEQADIYHDMMFLYDHVIEIYMRIRE